MARRAVFAICLLAVANGLLICVSGWAQAPPAQGCSWSAVSSEKLRANADEKANGKAEPSRTVIVERIEFDRPVHLSTSDVEQVIKMANENAWDAASPAWVDALAETGLRSAWQDQGYFKVAIDPRAQSLGSDSNHERFLVAVHMLNEGPQYHLGDIRFTGGTAFSEGELRQVFPLRGGEIFSVRQVRAGIDALTKLYNSRGYIDFTAVPNTESDDNLQRISLMMFLDEQKQFRVGSVEIRGLDPSLEARLRALVVPGEVFNLQPIETFFKENRPLLPSRGMDNFQIRRNARTGIVDLTFDPRFCLDSK